MNTKSELFLAVSAIAVCVSAPATAQMAAIGPEGAANTDAGSAGTSPQTPTTGTPSGASAELTQEGLGDIVVTAQRRSESLQRVPIAITAASGETLVNTGISDTAALNTLAPGLNVRSTTGAYQPSIRGIGTSASVVENPVALYVDGVYLPQQREGVRELNDVEQIAVLKGPQGTLFGRNATGGVIQITTRAPSHSFGGELNLRRENYNMTHADVYVTGGLTDTLAFSASGEISHQGTGWGRNRSTGNDTYYLDHRYSGRAKLLFQPDAATNITLIGDYTDWQQFTTDVQPYPGTSFVYGGIGPLRSVYDTYGQSDGQVGFKGGGVSLNADHEFDFAKLVSITAYRDGNGFFDFDFSGATPTRQRTFSYHQPSRSFTQEIQLLSSGSGPFKWVVGGYMFHYLNATNGLSRLRVAPISGPGMFFSSGKEISDSLAPFAQADWEFLPATKLTFGVRYTHEKRTISGQTNTGSFTPGPAVPKSSVTIDKTTFRVALTHDFRPGLLGYLSFNSGIKSGGFNVIAPRSPAYLPETIKAYEGGFKSEFFGRKLRFNVGGFYYDYSNIQVNRLTPAGQIVVNGAQAELYGLDVDVDALIARGLRLSGGFEMLHAKFTDYPNGVASTPIATGGALIQTADLSGRRLPLSQKFAGTAGIDYDSDLAIGGKIHLNATANYNGQYYFEPDNFLQQKSYTLVNASIKYTLPNNRYSLSVWGKNLLDKRVLSQAASLAQGYIAVYGNAPLTYGVTAQLKF